MSFWEDFKNNIQQIVTISTVAAFLLWSVVQLYYLNQYNAMGFFSLSQTFIDWTITIVYSMLYIFTPVLLTIFLQWKFDRKTEKRSKYHVLWFVWSIVIITLILIIPTIINTKDILDNVISFENYIIRTLPVILFFLNIRVYNKNSSIEQELSNKDKKRYKKANTIMHLNIRIILILWIIYLLDFRISLQNLSINILFLSLTISWWINLREAIKIQKDKKWKPTKNIQLPIIEKISIYEIIITISYLILLLALLIAPLLYVYKLGKHIIKQDDYYLSQEIENQKVNILYKNDIINYVCLICIINNQ